EPDGVDRLTAPDRQRADGVRPDEGGDQPADILQHAPRFIAFASIRVELWSAVAKLPLWSAVACHRSGVGGVRWSDRSVSPPPPLPPQSGGKPPHSKAAAPPPQSDALPRITSRADRSATFPRRGRPTRDACARGTRSSDRYGRGPPARDRPPAAASPERRWCARRSRTTPRRA